MKQQISELMSEERIHQLEKKTDEIEKSGECQIKLLCMENTRNRKNEMMTRRQQHSEV